MKKLLLTSALVGSLVSGISVANSATSITGNLGISYVATSNDTSGATSGSYNGFGLENQINLAGSGDLNNGMKYAAGFSWEMDGDETLSGAGMREGTYIEFISGGTTIGINGDRADNLDGIGANFVGFGYSNISTSTGAGTSIMIQSPNDPYGEIGFNLRQDLGGGNKVSVFYVPNSGGKYGRDIQQTSTKTLVDGGESAYSIVYTGNLAGVGIKAGVNQTNGASTFSDLKGQGVQLDYTFGKTKVGASYARTESSAATGSAAVKNTTYQYGIGHAISDTVSVGAYYADAETSTASTTNEKIMGVAVGYNLGPVSVQLMLKDAQDIGGATGTDATQVGMYVGTKF
jgi:hypothetical protein